jgi:hypothetical protein
LCPDPRSKPVRKPPPTPLTVKAEALINGSFQLITVRADAQFNTAIYTEDGRFRGMPGSRMLVPDQSRRRGEARP